MVPRESEREMGRFALILSLVSAGVGLVEDTTHPKEQTETQAAPQDSKLSEVLTMLQAFQSTLQPATIPPPFDPTTPQPLIPT